MDLLFLLYSLLRKKWVILICTVVGIAAGLTFTLFRPKEFVSLAQYSTGFTMEKKVKIQAEESFNIYEIDIRFSNLMVAFNSDKVIGMLSSKLMLHDLESVSPFRKLTEDEKKRKEYTQANFEKAKQILRKKINDIELLSSYNPDEKMVMDLIKLYKYDVESIMRQMRIERAERTDFINIFGTSENPELSAYMVNTSGDQFIRFFNSIYGFRNQEATGKLDSLTIAKKNVVDSLTKKLREFKEQMGPMSKGEASTAAMAVVTELYGKYQEESRELNRLKAELKSIEEQIYNLGSEESVTKPVSNNDEILRLKNRNVDLENSKNGKSDEEKKRIQKEIDDNTDKIIKLAPIRTTDRSKETEKKNTRRDELLSRKIELQNQILATESNVAQFLREKNKYEVMIKEGGGADVFVKEMERDLELAIKEYDSFRQSLTASLDLKLNPENSFKQILVGVPAEKPSPSRKPLFMGLAGFLMFFFSTFIILLLEFIDSSYKTPTIFTRATKLNLLSSVASIDLEKTPVKTIFSDAANAQSDLFVERFRKLRFELEDTGKKTFLITSTRDGEGKSLVIEALAHSFSQARKKVLIVDANFSNNDLTQRFNAKPVLEKISLSDAVNLHGEKLASWTTATGIANVDIIGCTQGHFTPSEILPRKNFFDGLGTVSTSYDIVLIEAASLNVHTDAKELMKYVESVAVVVSAKSSSKPADRESFDFLKQAGDQFAGAVFNKVEPDYLDL